MDTFLSYLTIANLAFVISVISLGINLKNFFDKKSSEKINISIDVYNYTPLPHELSCAIDIGFINHSSLPVTITGLELFVESKDKKSFSRRSFGEVEKLWEITKNGVPDTIIRTNAFPLNVPQLGAGRGIYKFRKLSFLPQAIPEMKSKIKIYTNRGSIELPLELEQVLKERALLNLEEYL